MLILAFSSPFASRRMPSGADFTRPAAFSAAASTGLLASSRPASMAPCRLPMFTTLKLRAKMLLKPRFGRSEEHTSELQSLMRMSYAVFRLEKKRVSDVKSNERDAIVLICYLDV